MSEVNGVRTMEQRYYELTISDGEIVPAANYSTDRQMRIEYVILNWRRHDRGAWLLDTPKIGGTVLRKDGSDGKNRASRNVSWNRVEWPEWLTELTNFYNPVTSAPTTHNPDAAALGESEA